MTEETRPQPGPQTNFLATEADIAIMGGAAGGGKSWALCFEAMRNASVKGYAAAFFRRTTQQLTGGGSVWEESEKLFPLLGGIARAHRLDWHFPSGATVEFCHLQHEKDKHNHQSKQYALICFDELVQFTSGQFWYLVSRNRSTCGVRPYIRAATNPDPDSFVLHELLWWWIDEQTGFYIPERAGVIRWFVRDGDKLYWADTAEELSKQFPDNRPTSLTFIPAKLQDNPALMEADPGYLAKLMALPMVDRERLLGGNWKIRAKAGNVFRRDWFEVVDASPTDVVDRVRSWDRAGTKPKPGTDPDATAGVKMSKAKDGTIYVEHVTTMRETPGNVDRAMLNLAKSDGKLCKVGLWQDPGAAGKAEIEHLTKMLQGFTTRPIKAAQSKLQYAPICRSWKASRTGPTMTRWTPAATHSKPFLIAIWII
jgi:hypothetical protein